MTPFRFKDLALRCLVVVAVIGVGYLVGTQVEGVGGGLLTGAALGAGVLVAVSHDGLQRGESTAPTGRRANRSTDRRGR